MNCKYMFMFFRKNLAHKGINLIIGSRPLTTLILFDNIVIVTETLTLEY